MRQVMPEHLLIPIPSGANPSIAMLCINNEFANEFQNLHEW